MSQPDKLLDSIKDGRYNLALYAGAIFSILMLVYKDLPAGRFKSIFVPSVGVFALGIGVLCHIQSNYAWAAHNKQKAAHSSKSDEQAAGGASSSPKAFEGLQETPLHAISCAFLGWFILFLLFQVLVFFRYINN